MMSGKMVFISITLLMGTVSGDIWDNAERYHADLTTVLYASIENATNTQLGVILRTRTVAVETLDAAESVLVLIKQYLDTEIEKIRNQTTDENRELSENCIGLFSDEIARLPEFTLNVITECVTAYEVNNTKELEGSIYDIQGFIYVADDTRKNIEDCRLAANSEECIARVVIEILLLTSEIPTNIRELTIRTKDLAEYYIEEIPFCSPPKIEEASVISRSLIRIIRSCANIPSY